MKIFKGLTHVHSTYSFDGRLSLGEIKSLFIAQGYSFALMSEHVEGMKQRDYARFLEECRALSNDEFLIIPGLEFHAECVSINGLTQLPRNLEKGRRLLMEECLEQNTVNVFVHPSLRRSLPRQQIIDKIHAVEVWNSKYDGARYPSYENIKIWKTLSRLRKQTPIFAVDFHERLQLVPISIGIEAEHLSIADVLDAIKEGKHALYYRERRMDLDGLSWTARSAMQAYWIMRRVADQSYHAVSRLLPASFSKRLKTWINGRPYA